MFCAWFPSLALCAFVSFAGFTCDNQNGCALRYGWVSLLSCSLFALARGTAAAPLQFTAVAVDLYSVLYQWMIAIMLPRSMRSDDEVSPAVVASVSVSDHGGCLRWRRCNVCCDVRWWPHVLWAAWRRPVHRPAQQYVTMRRVMVVVTT